MRPFPTRLKMKRAATSADDDDGDDGGAITGARKRVRAHEYASAAYGDVKVDPSEFKDDSSAQVATEDAGDAFAAADSADVGGDVDGGKDKDRGKRVRGPNHNARMHPRNEYFNRRPDFAALAAAVPSFAPLYVCNVTWRRFDVASRHYTLLTTPCTALTAVCRWCWLG